MADRVRSSEIVIYRTPGRGTRIQVRLDDGTVWLEQIEIAALFETTKQNVSGHLRNIYAEGELDRSATVKDYLTVRQEGGRQINRKIEYYNLDAILAVGYRVRSPRGTQFRQWATERLKEYVIKGFTLDDDRLKQAGGGDYFDELLARIRDIRSSERVFYQKVLDIYASSTDYDSRSEVSQAFFAAVQNKMHWAAHGHTAAELIVERADGTKRRMGLTNWKGAEVTRAETGVAKNYLTKEELQTLNLIVSAYLDFAELQASNRRPMTMRDWIAKLDDFLSLSERDILTHAGQVSREQAERHIATEWERYRQLQQGQSQVDRDFEAAIEAAKLVERERKRLPSEKPKGKRRGGST